MDVASYIIQTAIDIIEDVLLKSDKSAVGLFYLEMSRSKFMIGLYKSA